jgi:WD40 repeat protein
MFHFKKGAATSIALLLLTLISLLSHVVFTDRSKPPPKAAWPPLSVRTRTPLQGSLRSVHAAAFSPDGKYVALAGAEPDTSGWLRLWDAATGRELGTAQRQAHVYSSVTFSPDGRLLASANARGLQLCKLTGQGESTTLQSVCHPVTRQRFYQPVRVLAFAPDGGTLAIGQEDGTLRLVGLAAESEKVMPSGHRAQVRCGVFSPDGRLLASGSQDGAVKLWDVETGNLLATLEGHESLVWAVAFSPDGQTLASASEDRTVRLWDVRTAAERIVLRGHMGMVSCVAFSRDGRLLATGGMDDSVRVWDVATGQPRGSASGHQTRVSSVAFHDGDATLLSCEAQGTVWKWDATRVH